jgi:hypothetical protein
VGSPVTVTSAEITALHKVGKDSSMFQGELSIAGETMRADLSSLSLPPGRYEATLAITTEGRSKATEHEEYFTVYDTYEVGSVKIGSSGSKKLSVGDLTEVESEFGLLTPLQASAMQNEYLHLHFSVSSKAWSDKSRFVKPHQIFIKFTNALTGKSFVFDCAWDGKLEEGLGGKYYYSLALSEESTTFGYASAEYMVSILVGDFIADAAEWSVGNARLEFNAAPKKEVLPLYTKSLLDASDKTLTPLPEISHRMRPPAKRASAVMSALFAVLTLLPLLALVRFVLSLKLNLDRLKGSNVLFIACVLAALLLYGGYWLALPGMSFYDTIKYIAFLAPVTFFVGRNALGNLASAK